MYMKVIVSNVHNHGGITRLFKGRTRRTTKLILSNVVLAILVGCLATTESAYGFQTKKDHSSRSRQFLKPKKQVRPLRPAVHLFLENKTIKANKEEQKRQIDPSSLSRPRVVQFERPLLQEGYPPAIMDYEAQAMSEKPLLIYLPGFDGTWLAPFLQFPELSTEFDIRCLKIEMSDRSTFIDLRETVIDYLMEELTHVDNSKKEETVIDPTLSSSDTTQKLVQLKSKDSTKTPKSPNSPLMNFWNKNKANSSKSETTNVPRSSKIVSNRPVYLMGESFGGILASDVTLSLLEDDPNGISKNIKGLTLVNAATCFDRSKLALEGPGIAKVPILLYPLALIRLLPLFTDEYSFPQLLIILQSKGLPSVIDSEEREAYMGRIAFSLPQKLKFMPQETLAWRLSEWLDVGCSRMDTKLDRFQKFPKLPVLIIAGEKDKTLPSIAEAERLSSILPNTIVHVVEGAGHASTCGSRVDLTALMRGSFPEILQPKQKNNGSGPLDWMIRRNSPNTLKEDQENNTTEQRRTAMKPVAAEGKGIYFGLEPRYNGKEQGLSPLLYWSQKLYKKWK